jgi:hypothetical protein
MDGQEDRNPRLHWDHVSIGRIKAKSALDAYRPVHGYEPSPPMQMAGQAQPDGY